VIDTTNDIVQQRRAPQDAARELDQLQSISSGSRWHSARSLDSPRKWDYDADRRQECEREILAAAESLRRNFGQ